MSPEAGIVLRHRVISSIFIVAALLAAACWLPAGGLVVIVMAIGMLGAYEFTRLVAQAGLRAETALTVAGVGCYLGVLGWVGLPHGPGAALEAAGVVLAAWFACLCARAMRRTDGTALAAVGAASAGMCYTGVLLGFMVLLLELGGRFLPLYMILVVKVTDTAAYLVGSAIGRHRAFPRISPGKTWEGCLGGAAAAILVSLAVAAATNGAIGAIRIPLLHAGILGALLAGIAITGDLVESVFKRAAGEKDSGTWIRGMGGVLDVIDSLLFASPLLYGYVRWCLA